MGLPPVKPEQPWDREIGPGIFRKEDRAGQGRACPGTGKARAALELAGNLAALGEGFDPVPH
jgi:hypothetical protein